MTRSPAALSIAFLAVTTTVAAGQKPVSLSRGAIDTISTELDSVAEAHRVRQSIPGLSIAVMTTGGQLLYARGYGLADVASRQPVTSSTRFRIYSISKVYAATVAHQLAEVGRLSLDSSVGRYLPDLPPWRDTITIRQLLAHTSGIMDYSDVEGYQESVNAGRSEDDHFVAVAIERPLLFSSGTRWSYSNTGYVVIQRVVERVAGQSLAQSLAPLIANGSLVATSAECGQKGLATGYTPAWRLGLRGDSLVDSPLRNAHQWPIASGGLCSTPTDVARFMVLLVTGRLVDSASFADMTQLVPRGVAQSGSGLFRREDAEGFILMHSGGGGNGNSHVMVFPRDSLVLAAAANTGGAELEELLRALRRRILRLPDPLVADLPVARGEIAAIRGTYPMSDGGGRLVVYERDGQVFGYGSRLLKQSDGSFVPDLSRALRLVFKYEHGAATEVAVTSYGMLEGRMPRRP